MTDDMQDKRTSDKYRDLFCPHCDIWIGDPCDPDIESISLHHDIDQCEASGEARKAGSEVLAQPGRAK